MLRYLLPSVNCQPKKGLHVATFYDANRSKRLYGADSPWAGPQGPGPTPRPLPQIVGCPHPAQSPLFTVAWTTALEYGGAFFVVPTKVRVDAALSARKGGGTLFLPSAWKTKSFPPSPPGLRP